MAGRPTQYQKLSLRATADIKNLKAGLGRMRKEMRKTKETSNRLKTSLASAGGAFVAALSIRQIGKFGTELLQLSEVVGGVSKAFEALNQPGLLDQLREATGNAVDDLTLMQKAVQARNFKIPLEKLGSLLQFAAIRAAETGESVDYLVESIITGLGRKSVMILDNLGISATEIRDRMKETGDFAQAVADIVEEGLGKAALTIDEAALSTDKLLASWKNLKITISEFVKGPGKKTLDWITNFIDKINEGFEAQKVLKLDQYFTTLAEAQEALLKISRGEAPPKNAMIYAQLIVDITDAVIKLGYAADGTKIKMRKLLEPPTPPRPVTPGITRPDSPIIGIQEMVPGAISAIESLDVITATYQQTVERLKEELNELKDAAKETFEETMLSGVTAIGDIMTPLFTEFAAAFTEGQNALQQFWDFFKKWALQLAVKLAGLIALAAVLNALLPGAGGFKNIFGALGGGGFQDILKAFKAQSALNLAPSFQTGTDFVPKTGLALLHRGEAVIPARANRVQRIEIFGTLSGRDIFLSNQREAHLRRGMGAT